MKYLSKSEKDTFEFGKEFAQNLKKGDVVAIYGEIGAGKTVFIKGIMEGLGYKGYVKSPSFTIVREYNAKIKVYHIDLYRLSQDDLKSFGYEEFFYSDGICIIEWADRAKDLLPEKRIDVKIKIISETEREIEVNYVDGY